MAQAAQKAQTEAATNNPTQKKVADKNLLTKAETAKYDECTSMRPLIVSPSTSLVT